MTVAVDASADGSGLAVHVPDLLAGRGGWRLVSREPWWLAIPPGHQRREQGWKLHLSATVVDAPAVLRAAARVLTADPCAFKFAATERTVRFVGGRGADRASAGKFLTAYPDDDDHFRRLAEGLHAATHGLCGPAILTDRQYRPDSVVYYRFGGFTDRAELDNDGMYRRILTSPDGSPVDDRREARFAPPPWAVPPLPANPRPAQAAAPRSTPAGEAGQAGQPDQAMRAGTPERADNARPAVRAVLLGGRYLVRQAIRHSTKGGVFLAEPMPAGPVAVAPAEPGRAPGEQVVVKQARPHTECDTSGQDSRDLLRNEARMLDLLAPRGLAPARLSLFEQNDQLFLVERRLDGQPLRQWVEARTAGAATPSRYDAVVMARRLVALLDRVHRAGVVLRDLSPTNVVVDPAGQPRVVDLELAAVVGTVGRRGGTPGYQAPEQSGDDREHTRAEISEDLFSLGALFFLLATGADPILPDELGADAGDRVGRGVGRRLVEWLELAAAGSDAARALAPAARGLLHDDPARRWDLAMVRRALRRSSTDALSTAVPTVPAARPAGRDRLLGDGLARLLHTMAPASADRLWPAGALGDQTDPCNVQYGAAGILAVLTRATRLGDPSLPDPRQAATVVSDWLAHRADAGPRLLPGLYFGRAGAAWALHDAADVLERPDLAVRAVELALRLPTDWPNPDITHGMAGAGLAHLHLAARTGDPRLADRARYYADAVAARAERTAQGVCWPIPASFDSRLAGLTHLGFAHGVAGIGWFLLAAARATGAQDYLDLAVRAGQTLCDTARCDGPAAWWPVTPTSSERYPHWCSGSAGVGTFLLRLFRQTGEQRFGDLADAAAHAVHRARWRSRPSVCHGLAGDGEFLLDMAGSLGEPRFREWAEDLVDLMYVRRAVVDGRAVVPDESGRTLTAGYNTGLAGVVAFLLRLRHGGPRLWMSDLDVPPAVPDKPSPTGSQSPSQPAAQRICP